MIDKGRNRMRLGTLLYGLLCLAAGSAALADPVPVTVDNFRRAESDFYFQKSVDDRCFATLCHDRVPVPVNDQKVVGLNRDTLYSNGVFDLSSPLTVTLPKPAGRFQSLLLINEDHYAYIQPYGPATFTITEEAAGSRYAMLAFRTFVNPVDPADVEAANALQDQIIVSQAEKGTFSIPEWKSEDRDALRAGLIALNRFNPSSKGRFGSPEEADPVRSLIATAAGWGGNPLAAAVYVTLYPQQNDGNTPYEITLKDVPVDGFWSVTVYNKDRFFEAPETAISVNSVTAKPEPGGSVKIRFGGDPAAANYLRIMPGWNYTARLYRPRPEILDGSWTFPEAVKAQ
jgi:hypothetical protein